ncbi:predicted protein [Nematostella vectensis]|uniref:Uncharacterized protein n=2 Tax=Nematostella vectensis TaxID=45351 RepID=A7S833_NEMVE|nr:predicted protein [Nematostella vectensis]|eukprot:XP_001632158.1 predicted protein [Nematostella vectensis]
MDQASAMEIMADTNNDQLKLSVYYLLKELQKQKAQNAGVQALSERLETKSEECKGLESRVDQYKVLLARAENRLAQLSLQSGKGPHAAKGIITPGVNKRVVEGLTRQNTKLKIALSNLLKRGPKSVDLAEENLDLTNMVVALKDDLEKAFTENKELRDALLAVENDDTQKLQQQVANLSAKQLSTERTLRGLQTYCDKLVSENEWLKKSNESICKERIVQVAQLRTELGSIPDTNPEVKEVMAQAYGGDEIDGNAESLKKKIQELENTIKHHEEKTEVSDQEKEKLRERIALLEEAISHRQDKIQRLEENGSTLDRRLAEIMEELENLKKENETLNTEKILTQQQCSVYENDFKMEKQEKERLMIDFKEIQEQHKRLREENQRYQAMARHLEWEIQKQKSKTPSPPPQTQYSPYSCAPRMPWTPSLIKNEFMGGLVEVDGPKEDPSRQQRQQPLKRPQETTRDPDPNLFEAQAQQYSPRTRPSQTPSRKTSQHSYGGIKCPVCDEIFPHDQIEEHLVDCVPT